MANETRNPSEKGGQQRPGQDKHQKADKGGQRQDDNKNAGKQSQQDRGAGQPGRKS